VIEAKPHCGDFVIPDSGLEVQERVVLKLLLADLYPIPQRDLFAIGIEIPWPVRASLDLVPILVIFFVHVLRPLGVSDSPTGAEHITDLPWNDRCHGATKPGSRSND